MQQTNFFKSESFQNLLRGFSRMNFIQYDLRDARLFSTLFFFKADFQSIGGTKLRQAMTKWEKECRRGSSWPNPRRARQFAGEARGATFASPKREFLRRERVHSHWTRPRGFTITSQGNLPKRENQSKDRRRISFTTSHRRKGGEDPQSCSSSNHSSHDGWNQMIKHRICCFSSILSEYVSTDVFTSLCGSFPVREKSAIMAKMRLRMPVHFRHRTATRATPTGV